MYGNVLLIEPGLNVPLDVPSKCHQHAENEHPHRQGDRNGPKLHHGAGSPRNPDQVHAEETSHETRWEEDDGDDGKDQYRLAVFVLLRLDELYVLYGEPRYSLPEFCAVQETAFHGPQ